MHLLSKSEIENIFNDGFLYEKESFHIIEKSSLTYDVNRKRGSFLEEATVVRQAFLSGHTIIVKNLENFNSSIRIKAASLGREVDVHMYLVPAGGEDSFDFHTDDRDVYVNMVYGEKKFIVKKDNNEHEYVLKAGDELFIKKGSIHKAIPTGPSCQLSFGVDTRDYYKIYGGIRSSELSPSLADS